MVLNSLPSIRDIYAGVHDSQDSVLNTIWAHIYDNLANFLNTLPSTGDFQSMIYYSTTKPMTDHLAEYSNN
jgi:hypothetical protein